MPDQFPPDEFAGCRATYRLACGCRIEAGPDAPRLALGQERRCGTGTHGLQTVTGVTFHAPSGGG